MREGPKGTTGGTIVLAAAAALVGGCVGALATRLMQEDAARPGETPAADSGQLAPAMQALAAEVAGLREVLAQRPATVIPTDGGAAAVPAPVAAMPGLQSSLEQVVAALSDVALRVPPATALRLPEPDPQRRERARALIGDSKALGAHMFWSCQQLLDAYGLPSMVNVTENGTERWIYAFDTQGHVYFTIHDGRVTSMWSQ